LRESNCFVKILNKNKTMPAKSRLKPEIKKTLLKTHKKREPVSTNQQKYIKHLPLLILSIPFYFAVYYILTNVYPQDIANIPIYNSYLGLLISFFLANKLLISYLSLNSRRGTNISFVLTILLFLKLQHFIFEYWWFMPIMIFFVIDENFTKKIKFKRRKKNKA
jgi:hypothetical protein